MSELKETGSSSRRNPLVWISLVVIGLIMFVFLNSKRGDSIPVSTPIVEETTVVNEASAGTIDRSLLVPPGMRARQYIEQLRNNGKPYPLEEVFVKAQEYQQEGNLADAHLTYFFGAREEHVPSIMMMGEMSDPILFRAEDALLDNADVIQAYKWYQKAAEMGYPPANERVASLQQWARDEAEVGNPLARQLLLNIQ
jgi:hypothetical protein